MEFKLTVGHLANRKRGGSFTIFHDSDNSLTLPELKTTTQQIEATHPRLAPSRMDTLLPQTRATLPFMTTPWLQPQFQHALPFHGFYMTQGPGNPSYYTHQSLDMGKENVDPFFTRTNKVDQSRNPLGWSVPTTDDQDPYNAYHGPRYDNGREGLGGLASNYEHFGYSANPLSVAFQHLQAQQESPFTTGETPLPPSHSFLEKNQSASPDGTISDQESHEYIHGLFATSE